MRTAFDRPPALSPQSTMRSRARHPFTELLSLSTPAAKFESGLRCALGGAFGVDVSLAAAAQRDAGATIVNVTSTVQHIPHVGGLKQPELAGTLSLLQETLMEVYTSYRGVVAKHASLAAMVQAPALLQFLQQSSVQHDDFPHEDPTLPDMDVTEYLQSQVSEPACQCGCRNAAWQLPSVTRLPVTFACFGYKAFAFKTMLHSIWQSK